MNMKKKELNNESPNVNEGVVKNVLPKSIVIENADEYYEQNGYMSFDEFINKVSKLV